MRLYYIMGTFLGTQAEARAAAKEHGVKFVPEQDTVEVPTDKEGLIGYLNRMGQSLRDRPEGDYDTGRDEFTTVVERQDPPAEQEDRPNPLEFDDAFEQMPLARQLHFAAIACENAREQLGRETRPKLAPQGYGGSQPRFTDEEKAEMKHDAQVDDDLLS